MKLGSIWFFPAAALLAGCALPPVHYGPPDLDTTSAAAPRCPAQTYPFHSLENLEQGEALVEARVAADGSVQGAALRNATESAWLDEASVAAVRSCRFSAGAAKTVVVTVDWTLIGGFELPTGIVSIGVQPSQQPAAKPAR